MNSKRAAHEVALKVKKRLNNRHWHIQVYRDGGGESWTYKLMFDDGLLSLYPGYLDDFFCLLNFDEDHAGTGDMRFSGDKHFDDPLEAVNSILQTAQAIVDAESRKMDRINELMGSPKRR